MSYRRPQVNRDLNHPAITAELEQCGFSVADLAAAGDDVPDLAVGKWGVTMLVEVKSHKKIRKSKGDGRTEGQIIFAESWKGGPVIVAETAEQIINAFEMEQYRQCNRTTGSMPLNSSPLNQPLSHLPMSGQPMVFQPAPWTPAPALKAGQVLLIRKGRRMLRAVVGSTSRPTAATDKPRPAKARSSRPSSSSNYGRRKRRRSSSG